jgi:hypothetical protein
VISESGLVSIRYANDEGAGGVPISRQVGEAWIAHMASSNWKLEPVPGCQCCGQPATVWYVGEQRRCHKHWGRNPCLIEGCTRTTAVKDGRHHCEDWICGLHWRSLVPPRSKLRRTYHAHFRRAKRIGWTPETEEKFWRFWTLLVRQARRRADHGFVDEAEINRLMGWN